MADPVIDEHAERLEPGTRIDRYEVIELLAESCKGRVYRARDLDLLRDVALEHVTAGRHLESAQVLLLARARIDHPAVVRLYNAETVDGTLFVAMELAPSETLAHWLCERPRSWRDIVRVLIEAGQGLAAAHGVGLIHRDLQPSKILMDGHGHPKISDFGSVEIDAVEVGTVDYMAPEQLIGEARLVDARTDQFAWCVVLWTALFGSRPFAGSTPAELHAAIHAGSILAPTHRRPRRLIRALRRGLAADPSARWPDMASLVEELRRVLGARQRWTVALIASAVAISSAVGAVVIVGGHAAPDLCSASTAAVWNEPRREALHAKIVAIDPVQGEVRFDKIAAAIETGAERWSAMRVEVCRATHRRSEPLLDRRIACLDRWIGELADTVNVTERAGDRGDVDQAVRASTALSPLAACADVRALSQAVPLPTGAARATAIALARRTQELDVEQRAGRIAGLPAKVREVVAAARNLDHAPTLASALVLQARVDFAIDDDSDAKSALRELAQVAARAHDDWSAAFAWIQLIATIGGNEGKLAAATTLIPIATAAVLRAGDPTDLRADLLFAQAEVTDHAAARGLLARARRLLEQSGATSAGSPLARRLIQTTSALAATDAAVGDNDAAIATYRDVIDRWRALYGNDSPDEAYAWGDLAIALETAGKHDESLAAYRRALAIREARLGDSSMTTFSREILAMALHMQGRWDEALEAHDRAIRSYRAEAKVDDSRLTRTLGNRAETLAQLGRFDEAARGYDEVLARLERGEPDPVEMSMTLYNRGELQRKRGRCEVALRDYTRSADVAESLHEVGASLLIPALVGEAACLLGSRHFDEAIARLNRVLALEATTDQTFQVALARAYLGRAQVETRRDGAGGLAAVRSARDRLAAAADATNIASVRELDVWLAAHTR